MNLLLLLILYSLICLGDCRGIEGTWLSKSRTVITGPQIYDPIDELIYEPKLPGMAYSFDSNGNWEQTIYHVWSNPRDHRCPTATLLWQHGKYQLKKDGSLILKPYPSDGRKLFSDPCKTDESIYMRYNQEEKIKHFKVEYDQYNSKYKLQLYAVDGSKKQPLWLEYSPPVMLPTTVLNPTDASEKDSLLNFNRKLKRSLENRANVNLDRSDAVDTVMFHVFSLTGIGILSLALRFVVINLRPKKIHEKSKKNRFMIRMDH